MRKAARGFAPCPTRAGGRPDRRWTIRGRLGYDDGEMRAIQSVAVIVLVILLCALGARGPISFAACWPGPTTPSPACWRASTTDYRKTNEQDQCHHARGNQRAENAVPASESRWVISREQSRVISRERRRPSSRLPFVARRVGGTLLFDPAHGQLLMMHARVTTAPVKPPPWVALDTCVLSMKTRRHRLS
jgi:hypothetical protein